MLLVYQYIFFISKTYIIIILIVNVGAERVLVDTHVRTQCFCSAAVLEAEEHHQEYLD